MGDDFDLKHFDPKASNLYLWFNHGVDLEKRIIYLTSHMDSNGDGIGITYPTAANFIKSVYNLNQENKHPIRVLMNCNGGASDSGFAIYDCIKGSKAPIDIEVFGMAAIILQAARKRYLHPNTTLLLHNGKTDLEGKSPEEGLALEAWNRRLNKQMYSILSKRTGKPKKYWEDMCSFDNYFLAKEAVREGLANKVIFKNFFEHNL